MKLLNGIGLGTFPFASPFTPVDGKTAGSILDAYLNGGGRYIDTAPTYGLGKVEEQLGELLTKYPRDRFFINTSCGHAREGDTLRLSGKYKDVIHECDESLRRLKLDYVDLYISHVPDPATPFAETIHALKDLKRVGKAKRIGVSNVSLEQLQEYNASGAVEFAQNRFSLINQDLSAEFQAYCQAHNIGVVAYQVLDRGLLTEGVLKKIEMRSDDLRRRKPEFRENVVHEIRQWVGASLRPIAESAGVSITTLVIWWALQQPAIALCQCGATSLEQVRHILAASNFTGSLELKTTIDNAYATLESKIRNEHKSSVREFTGLATYNVYAGSPTGK
ncbi:MAG: aldo/keto reductase [Patescibacteria group bacterium]